MQCHANSFARIESDWTLRDGVKSLISSISCTKQSNGKMSVQVFRDNTVFVNEVFANGRRLFSVFRHALVQMPEYSLHNLHRTSHIEIYKLHFF